jgi:hypothetical protein
MTEKDKSLMHAMSNLEDLRAQYSTFKGLIINSQNENENKI